MAVRGSTVQLQLSLSAHAHLTTEGLHPVFGGHGDHARAGADREGAAEESLVLEVQLSARDVDARRRVGSEHDGDVALAAGVAQDAHILELRRVGIRVRIELLDVGAVAVEHPGLPVLEEGAGMELQIRPLNDVALVLELRAHDDTEARNVERALVSEHGSAGPQSLETPVGPPRATPLDRQPGNGAECGAEDQGVEPLQIGDFRRIEQREVDTAKLQTSRRLQALDADDSRTATGPGTDRPHVDGDVVPRARETVVVPVRLAAVAGGGGEPVLGAAVVVELHRLRFGSPRSKGEHRTQSYERRRYQAPAVPMAHRNTAPSGLGQAERAADSANPCTSTRNKRIGRIS